MDQATVGYVAAAIIVVAGILSFWRIKIRVRDKVAMDSFGTFFLGGGRVGEYLTGNNNWGVCFAFANSIWYYAFLGYYYGIYILFLQAAWSFAIVCIAFNLPRYLNASSDGTVHGFIGALYGAKASILAATATLIGYTLNVGFEIFYSAHLFAATMGVVSYELLFAMMFAVFIGGYCAVGGYLANVVTDPIQNWLGVVALVILGVLVGIPMYQGAHFGTLLASSAGTEPGWPFVIGVIVFSFFFNIVDMANWQSIAANSKLSGHELRPIRNGFIKAAALQMVAPALLGTFFGASLKILNSEVPDDGYFAAILGPWLNNMNVLTGAGLGLLLLGFFAVTISSAGSYLLAAMQTLALDIFKREDATMIRTHALDDSVRSAAETRVLDWVKRLMVIVCIAMTLAFAGLYYGLSHIDKQGLAFQFQFVMYGAAVTLVPSVVSGLRRRHSGAQFIEDHRGFGSILVGLICVIVPFALAELDWTHLGRALGAVGLHGGPDDVVNLTPLFGLVGAALAFSAQGKGLKHAR